jgi:multicomponent Na+:H+ antiporter subunit G
MIGELLALLGSLLILLAAVGVVRFDDVYARLHAMAKASTFAMLLVLGGTAISMNHADDISSVVLAAILQVITSPIAANAISTATYHSEGWPAGGNPRSGGLAPEGEH